MANDIENTDTVPALQSSLWRAIEVFVKKCGGEITKAKPEDCEQFGEEIQAWATLAMDEEETE